MFVFRCCVNTNVWKQLETKRDINLLRINVYILQTASKAFKKEKSCSFLTDSEQKAKLKTEVDGERH